MVSRIAPLTSLCSGVVPVLSSSTTSSLSHLPIPVLGSGVMLGTSASDHFPDRQPNVVPIHVSMGAYNSMQQSDAHSYWEFNYRGTNWVHPLYELPFTGGFPDNFGQAPDTFQDGEISKLQ